MNLFRTCTLWNTKFQLGCPRYYSVFNPFRLDESNPLSVPNAIVASTAQDSERRAGPLVFDLDVPEAISNLNRFGLKHDNTPQLGTFKNHRIADLSRFLFASHFLRRRLGCYWSNWSVHDPEAHCFKLEGPTTIRLSSLEFEAMSFRIMNCRPAAGHRPRLARRADLGRRTMVLRDRHPQPRHPRPGGRRLYPDRLPCCRASALGRSEEH